ncbi:unnamed protein product [Angiostrongylus costaricensis]|uniref:Reverse transcriptase domain-containing protein n=1 Tax=Angiostrongylus costaricensis TaxID=334426 RepID=A0A0R3PB59_ANGCS|nr:unnamed protein product [Angiostrongylus costaricensis]
MRTLEWDNIGVKIDGRRLHHLRFADDIILITPNIGLVGRMFDDFDKACGRFSLRLNVTKTMFTKNGLLSHTPLTLTGTNITECSSYLGRQINMMNDLARKLSVMYYNGLYTQNVPRLQFTIVPEPLTQAIGIHIAGHEGWTFCNGLPMYLLEESRGR